MEITAGDGTAEAEGILPGPEQIGLIFEVVALNTVGAKDISLLSCN